MWIGKILRKKSVIQLQFIWEHIYGNKEVTILKKAEKGILCLLSDLQNGVNTGAKRSWRRNITTCEEGKCLMISHNVRRRGVVRYDFLFVDNNISITKCNYDYDGAIKAGSDHALIEADIRT